MGYDVAVIGGGIAGLSAAAFLAEEASVVLLESEAMLSFHASGRSAAQYTECYGPGIVPELTKASRPFLTEHDRSLLTPRGVLFLGTADRDGDLDARFDDFARTVDTVDRVDHDECLGLVPVLDPDRTWSGIHEPGAMDIDIHGLETAYRTMVRAGDGEILLERGVVDLRRRGSAWELATSAGDDIDADVVVDAAGAWGDDVAELAGAPRLGLRPLRRSAFLTAGLPGSPAWPMLVDLDERWYLKPEGPNLLGSAADEVPSEPGDARPDEIDIALGIDRINDATTLAIRSVSSAWAGLRTFTPDRLPAVGFDPAEPTFFWLVGQGGYGIKTSPALGAITAHLVAGRSIPPSLAARGITEAALSPARFR